MELIIALLIVTWGIKYGVTDAIAAVKGTTPERWQRANEKESNKIRLAEARGEKPRWSQRGPTRRYAALLYSDALDDMAERHTRRREERARARAEADNEEYDETTEPAEYTGLERVAARIGEAVQRRREKRDATNKEHDHDEEETDTEAGKEDDADVVEEVETGEDIEEMSTDIGDLTPQAEGDFRRSAGDVFAPDDIRRFAAWAKTQYAEDHHDRIDEWSTEMQGHVRDNVFAPTELTRVHQDLEVWLTGSLKYADDPTGTTPGVARVLEAKAFAARRLRLQTLIKDRIVAGAPPVGSPDRDSYLAAEARKWNGIVDQFRADHSDDWIGQLEQFLTEQNTDSDSDSDSSGRTHLRLVPDLPETTTDIPSETTESEENTIMDTNSTEAVSLPAARAFYQGTALAALNAVTQVEMNMAYMQNGGVSGDPIAMSAQLMEALQTVASIAENIDGELGAWGTLREQYMANPDAGDKTFLTTGG